MAENENLKDLDSVEISNFLEGIDDGLVDENSISDDLQNYAARHSLSGISHATPAPDTTKITGASQSDEEKSTPDNYLEVFSLSHEVPALGRGQRRKGSSKSKFRGDSSTASKPREIVGHAKRPKLYSTDTPPPLLRPGHSGFSSSMVTKKPPARKSPAQSSKSPTPTTNKSTTPSSRGSEDGKGPGRPRCDHVPDEVLKGSTGTTTAMCTGDCKSKIKQCEQCHIWENYNNFWRHRSKCPGKPIGGSKTSAFDSFSPPRLTSAPPPSLPPLMPSGAARRQQPFASGTAKRGAAPASPSSIGRGGAGGSSGKPAGVARPLSKRTRSSRSS